MEVTKFTPDKRDIYGFYCGTGNYTTNEGYFIWSRFYGLVAYTLTMDREDDANRINRKVHIKLAVVDWHGEWSLRQVIERGIAKMERQYVDDKIVEIEFVEVPAESSLGRLTVVADIDHFVKGDH